MTRIIRLLFISIFCMFSSIILASYYTSNDKTAIEKEHTPNKLTGVYLGMGGGKNSLMVNRSSVILDDYHTLSYQSTAVTYFPVIQLGYWGNASSQWLWGIKTFYKYLNTSANYLFNASDLFYNNNDTQIPNEFSALVTFARHMKYITPYFGIGVLWLPKVRDSFRDYDNEAVSEGLLGHSLAGEDYSTQKSLIGGIFQLGLLYSLNMNWFLDATYSYGFTGKVLFDQTINTEKFSRNIRTTVQEFMLSINRRF